METAVRSAMSRYRGPLLDLPFHCATDVDLLLKPEGRRLSANHRDGSAGAFEAPVRVSDSNGLEVGRWCQGLVAARPRLTRR